MHTFWDVDGILEFVRENYSVYDVFPDHDCEDRRYL